MKNTAKNTIITSLAVILIIIVSGLYFYLSAPKSQNTGTEIPVAGNSISFPSGGESLVKGTTYTLAWNDGASAGTTTQIFLIDTALEARGASVSISDRVYDVPDTGSYQYTVPAALPDGTYKLEIGTLTSNPFQIVGAAQ